MTITDGRPWNLEVVRQEGTAAAGIDREYAGAVAELVEDARAEARAAGRQLRVIHRMWQLQEQAHEQRRVAQARWSHRHTRALGQDLPEPEKRTVLDVADEIGPALRLPVGTAVRRVENAVLLAEHLPRVLEALESGAIALRQAEVIADLWRDLVGAADRPPERWAPGEAVARVLDELLEKAETVTAAQLRALARRRRARLLAGSEEARHRVAHRGRRVWVEPEEDGMARLCALLDAATAHAVHDRLTSIAARVEPHGPRPDVPESAGGGQGIGREHQEGLCGDRCGGLCEDCDQGYGDGGPRTAGQLRADVLASLLLDGEPALMPEHLRGIRGHVTVTVPVLALLEDSAQTPGGGLPSGSPSTDGLTGGSPSADGLPGGSPNADGLPGARGPARASGCAELAGYGPIPVSLAERIAAGAGSWSRILTHPVTGTVLDHDRTTYTVPADLRRRLRARDGTCRFPGCRRRAERCDLDHTVAWVDGGPTAAGNLAHLCRHHHVLKHRHGPLGRWQVRHRDPRAQEGVLEWTSPAGRVHVTYPQEHHHPVLSPLRIHDDVPVAAPPPPASSSGSPTPGSPTPGSPTPGSPTAASPDFRSPWPDPPPLEGVRTERGPAPGVLGLHDLVSLDDPPPF
ncbi:HNH endonuclease signature motif containing protein [uncultured Kocuria sp.]|uniref:HNH endonuclease signature motif containing protein n=1 Tax=uncultured Kocuria sp. TaxID=259305 RepID=UPI00262AA780|nr:HNH endonuclease signature motif containing protein [uncultured Kocuria sp.]